MLSSLVQEVFNFISYPMRLFDFLGFLWYKFVCSCNNTCFQICPLISRIFFGLILRKIFKNGLRKVCADFRVFKSIKQEPWLSFWVFWSPQMYFENSLKIRK